MSDRPLAAVIMAAGQGKRMNNPDLAKVMNTLGGIPLVQHVIRLARTAGADPIIVVVGHRREHVIAFLSEQEPDVTIAVQAEQLGTGHAVQQAIPALNDFDGDVLILSGDAPLTRPETLRDALAVHRESRASVTVLTAVLPDPTGYGRVIRGDDQRIMRIVEHKDATDEERAVHEINSGIYVFEMNPLVDALGRITNQNAQGEYYLPDVFELFYRDTRVMVPFEVASFDELRGVNTVAQLQELEEIYAARQKRAE
ncbi:MAG: sugar phosphate nucleotidyltransferase [Bacteroidia bacterium]|nr:sugar phosphate nucleotidyltransferase [Bacteroidia bacterium]